MVDIEKLPLGDTYFSDFIENQLIYVDKTDLIAQLAKFRTPIFLSRPRRFGKSTLVNTFEELFSHGLEKFKGLKIETQNLWQDKTYEVIHLDLSSIKGNRKIRSFESKFLKHLNTKFKTTKLKIDNDQDVIASLNETLENVADRSLVLLIDEYDSPLTAVIGDKEEFVDRRELLSDFFSSIKTYSGKFRFIFITGVTRYSHTAIFSGFNNLKDISFDPDFGTIVGYTQEELEFYFKDYLENAANILNQVNNTTQNSYASILKDLKDNYDGYSFDEKCKTHVYNPWSILNFLTSPQNNFKRYWVDSGGSQPSLLVNYLNTASEEVLTQTKFEDFLNLDLTISTTINGLSPKISSLNDPNFPFLAILYQAGYFTIKEARETGFDIGIPNQEIKEAFAEIILEALAHKTIDEFSKTFKKVLVEHLNHKDLPKLAELFNTMVNTFTYATINRFNEATFTELLNYTALILKVLSSTEIPCAHGRADLSLEVNNYFYVFEIKVATCEEEISQKLQEAKAQIIDKKYDRVLKDKEIIALALVFINQKQDKDKGLKALHEVAALEEVRSHSLQ